MTCSSSIIQQLNFKMNSPEEKMSLDFTDRGLFFLRNCAFYCFIGISACRVDILHRIPFSPCSKVASEAKENSAELCLLRRTRFPYRSRAKCLAGCGLSIQRSSAMQKSASNCLSRPLPASRKSLIMNQLMSPFSVRTNCFFRCVDCDS